MVFFVKLWEIMVDMFRGIHNINLDGKGRIAIPTRYRSIINDQASGNMVITIDPEEQCLLLYPLSAWNEIEKKINDLPTFKRNARRVSRLLVGHAEDIQIDKNGRILISQPLRSFAELDKKITMIGQGTKFEIWGNNIWESKVSKWRTEETDESEDTVLGDIRI